MLSWQNITLISFAISDVAVTLSVSILIGTESLTTKLSIYILFLNFVCDKELLAFKSLS
jgi:hypothetical protein